MISPARVVVVVLPFDPVMATIGPGRNCAASSISPITFSPSARACTSGGASTGTPGLTTIRSCPRKVRSPWPPVSTAIPLIEQHRNFVAQFVAALGIGDSDARAVLFQKQRRGHPGLAEADHQHAFAVQFHQCHFTTEAQRHREIFFAADRHGFDGSTIMKESSA